MSEFNFKEFQKNTETRMQKSLDSLASDFAGLRTGRASVSLLDSVMVPAYGTDTPLNQVANVTVPESRMISVQVWDKAVAPAVEKAIREANLGLNPSAEGQSIRVPIPPLNEERRKELTKVASKYAEESRIAIRNIRRDANDKLKKCEKDNDISKDEHKGYQDDVQKWTNTFIKKVDDTLSSKEQEIMQV